MKVVLLVFISLALFSSCIPTTTTHEYSYRGVLDIQEKELAFPLHLFQKGDKWSGYVVNGADTTHFTSITKEGDSLKLSFDHFDSHLFVVQDKQNHRLDGRWTKRKTGGEYEHVRFAGLPQAPRYTLPRTSNASIEGEWNVRFEDADDSWPATGIFRLQEGILYGTFLTETGDYRFLEGVMRDSTFILSTFDAAHAFVFTGVIQNDEMQGMFYSGSSYVARFEGKKEPSSLRDPFSIAELVGDSPTLTFSFRDTNGKIISNTDSRFQNKPILLYLFGSWCPNCADEAAMLKELYTKFYQNTDLQIVGLAFEYTGQFESDAQMVKQYVKRFHIPWPVLVAGNSSKNEAAHKLPFIKEVTSFPTTFFADRNHKIIGTHVGFMGPGTGSYYISEKNGFKTHIDEILSN